MSFKQENEETGDFRKSLAVALARQSAPYGFICIHRRYASQLVVTENSLETDSLQAEVGSVFAAMTKAQVEVFIDNSSHMAVIASPRTLLNTNRLARVVRSQLMHDKASFALSMAVAHVDNYDMDASDLILDMSSDLKRNIKDGSSRIEVRHYKY